jgi:pullulanase
VLARKEMHKLALTIVLTSQGVPFLHAGTEFLRSKKGVENSFNSSDEINKINWFDKADNSDVFQYVRALISMRKDHPAFRLTTQKEVASLIDFKQAENGLIGYQINGKAAGDEWSKIFVLFNGNNKAQNTSIPAGSWSAFVLNNQISATGSTVNSEILLQPHSAAILYQK